MYLCIQSRVHWTQAPLPAMPPPLSHGSGLSHAVDPYSRAMSRRSRSPADCGKAPPCSSTAQPPHLHCTEWTVGRIVVCVTTLDSWYIIFYVNKDITLEPTMHLSMYCPTYHPTGKGGDLINIKLISYRSNPSPLPMGWYLGQYILHPQTSQWPHAGRHIIHVSSGRRK